MKKELLLKSLLCPVALCVATPCFLSLSNCSQEVKITDIGISTTSDYIMAGDMVTASAFVLPNKQSCEVTWELLNNPFGDDLTINEFGEIVAKPSIFVGELTTITIKAKLIENPEVFSLLDLAVVPTTPSDFLGFLGGKVQYYNRSGKFEDVSVIQDGYQQYIVTSDINVFYGWNPSDDQSALNFHPLIRKGCDRRMNFQFSNPCIKFINYQETDWVDRIPSFYVTNIAPITNVLTVKFFADEEVTLTIPIRIWNYPTSLTTAVFGYVKETGDQHDISPTAVDGTYSSHLLCPGDQVSGTYTNIMPSIYCFRKNFEYLDLNFEFNTSTQDPRIWPDGLTYDISVTKLEREVDHYPYYKISLTYTFDFDNGMISGDECEYETLSLPQLRAVDYIHESSPTPWAFLNFDIEWV